MKGLWFTEKQTPSLALSCEVRATLHVEQSPYQEIGVIDTVPFGRMLVLDGVIQTCLMDEFVYHEMISLVALNTHPSPRQVLVIGGGDGGAVREVVRHPGVERVTLAEIDERVIAVSRQYFPELSSKLDDAKVEIKVGDGIEHLKGSEKQYDIILVDSTDPIGPAVGLFQKPFYELAFNALRDDGILVAQTESPFYNRELIKEVYSHMSSLFPQAYLYLADIPTYPGSLWSFTMGSKRYDPVKADSSQFPELPTKYYSRNIHQKALTLPPFVTEMLR